MAHSVPESESPCGAAGDGSRLGASRYFTREGTIPVLRTCCLILSAALLFASPALAQSPSAGSGGLPSDAALHRLGLTRAWWGHSVTNSTRDKIVHITLDETSYFAQSSNGVITAF